MKATTCYGRGAKRKFAILMGVALLSFPVVPNLGHTPKAAGKVLFDPSAASAEPSQIGRQRQLPPAAPNEPGENSPKQQRDLLKYKFEKMKENADELAELAQSLQEDLSASNENVLSIKIVEKAKKIEKLAKKIKSAARGF